jgi:hypothetical protein
MTSTRLARSVLLGLIATVCCLSRARASSLLQWGFKN